MNFIIRTQGAVIGFLHIAKPSVSTDASVFSSEIRCVLTEVALALGPFIPVGTVQILDLKQMHPVGCTQELSDDQYLTLSIDSITLSRSIAKQNHYLNVGM